MNVKAFASSIGNGPRLGLAGVVGAVAGALGGYFYAKNRLELVYQSRMQSEIDDVRRFYVAMRSPETPEEVQRSIEKYTDMVKDQYAPSLNNLRDWVPTGITVVEEETSEEKPQEIEKRNVFEKAEENEPEEPIDPNKPYLIDLDTFETMTEDYEPKYLDFYDGDGVLADEKGHIDDIENTVGMRHILSMDAVNDTIYVANLKIDTVFCVEYNPGTYSETRLGFVQHDDRRGPRKFKMYRDE